MRTLMALPEDRRIFKARETLEIYALEDDLFGKNAYKGDNHMHTRFSDGKDSPEYMAAAACTNGYD